MFAQIVDWISASPWTYAIIFGVALVDAFFPLVPSEATVIAAGVLAGAGDLQITLVIAAAALGAIVGDNITYGLGTWLGEHTVKQLYRKEKLKEAFDWAERTLESHGMYLIVVSRFIPGGRTATMFTAGYTHAYTWRRFIVADTVAGLVWATYAGLIGYFGGKSFEEQPWKGLLIGFGIAIAVSTLIEGFRWWRRRRAAARQEAAGMEAANGEAAQADGPTG